MDETHFKAACRKQASAKKQMADRLAARGVAARDLLAAFGDATIDRPLTAEERLALVSIGINTHSVSLWAVYQSVKSIAESY